MTADSTQTPPRSRRALLAGALGGLGVWAASAIGRAAPAEAAAGDPIRMGRLNLASSTATDAADQTSRAASERLPGQPARSWRTREGSLATSGRAILGEAGSQGTGVWASSPNHIGVHAQCQFGYAMVWAEGDTAVYAAGNAVGVYAQGSQLAARFSGPTYLDGLADVQVSASPTRSTGGERRPPVLPHQCPARRNSACASRPVPSRSSPPSRKRRGRMDRDRPRERQNDASLIT